jgi:hypothetical protein
MDKYGKRSTGLQNRVTRILRRGEGPTVKLYVSEVLSETV